MSDYLVNIVRNDIKSGGKNHILVCPQRDCDLIYYIPAQRWINYNIGRKAKHGFQYKYCTVHSRHNRTGKLENRAMMS